ncbi:MAG: Rdx family protein [Blastocatellia bacterium]|nr:Rdx family protein [Blastocatellia bacterium]
MAEELKSKYQANSELVKLSGGIFEIYRDDQLIFSKRALGRFPNDGEIARLLDAVASGIPLAQAQAEISAPKPSGGFLSRLLNRS